MDCIWPRLQIEFEFNVPTNAYRLTVFPRRLKSDLLHRSNRVLGQTEGQTTYNFDVCDFSVYMKNNLQYHRALHTIIPGFLSVFSFFSVKNRRFQIHRHRENGGVSIRFWRRYHERDAFNIVQRDRLQRIFDGEVYGLRSTFTKLPMSVSPDLSLIEILLSRF